MIKRLFVLLGLKALFLNVPAFAHDLKDGHVERDVQVVIFPDRIEVQYTLEMNANTRDSYQVRLDSSSKSSASDGKTNSGLNAKWNRFRKALAPQLAKNMMLTIGGQNLSFEPVRSELVEKHSIRLYFVMDHKYKTGSSPVAITVRDKNFATFDGYHRLALKGRRGVVVSASSVPPIVSSLKRTAWSTMTKKEKSAATEARADFHLRASSN